MDTNERGKSDLFPKTGDALLVVDVQNDFLSGGRLPVPHGDDVIPILNRYLNLFRNYHLPVYASRDWHPEHHCSFAPQGGPWPTHCVAESDGAEFAPGLDFDAATHCISKATETNEDAYSAFQGTGLDSQLKQSGIQRLFVGGLATDYCVLNTVKDAIRLGYRVVLLTDAIRAVNVNLEDGILAETEMLTLGCIPATLEKLDFSLQPVGAGMTDLYQLTMLKAYHDRGMNGMAVFEFFVRSLPQRRNFLMAAGLEQVLEFLETLHFTPSELQWLVGPGGFPREFVDSLESFQFTGDVDAVAEGTVFFADEPILRITAPLPQAQLVETRIINILQYQSLVASKAARMVITAPNKTLVDFGLRRAHGTDAGLLAARASYLAGFSGSATVPSSARFGVPVFGTQAHSYIQAHDNEEEAFENFVRAWPEHAILLLDTYDTEKAAYKVANLARRLESEGIKIKGVRLDSGNLANESSRVRQILDDAGFHELQILASGGLDEYALERLMKANAPIDGFGIGTGLTVSEDAPSLNCAYKLQEYDGQPRRKRSEGKATWPGRKQIYRQLSAQGKLLEDHLVLEEETAEGVPLIKPYMRNGRRLATPEPLATIRKRAKEELARLPQPLRSLQTSSPASIIISPTIRALAAQLDRDSS